MTQRAWIDAMRCLLYENAAAVDRAGGRAPMPPSGERWQEIADLYIPLSKALCTDVGNELTSLALQVHGGMGFVEETGAAQHYRDIRIAAIYEGTNGIQAADLVGRKLSMRAGRRRVRSARRVRRRRRRLCERRRAARASARTCRPRSAPPGAATEHLVERGRDRSERGPVGVDAVPAVARHRRVRRPARPLGTGGRRRRRRTAVATPTRRRSVTPSWCRRGSSASRSCPPRSASWAPSPPAPPTCSPSPPTNSDTCLNPHRTSDAPTGVPSPDRTDSLARHRCRVSNVRTSVRRLRVGPNGFGCGVRAARRKVDMRRINFGRPGVD